MSNFPKVQFTVAEVADAPYELGKILVELRPDKAPKTVENFLSLVESGFYKGLIFHRVIKGFMSLGYEGKRSCAPYSWRWSGEWSALGNRKRTGNCRLWRGCSHRQRRPSRKICTYFVAEGIPYRADRGDRGAFGYFNHKTRDIGTSYCKYHSSKNQERNDAALPFFPWHLRFKRICLLVELGASLLCPDGIRQK